MARCVFCGWEGKLTKEHVWPRWLQDVFPPASGIVGHTSIAGEDSRRWGAVPFEQTVKDVCHSCNTGWMNNLEIAAQPLLKPMFKGHGKALHERGQATLATWGLKTIMMCALTQPSSPIIPHEHYTALYERRCEREPPSSVYVSLAAYSGQRWASYYRAHDLVVSFERSKGLPDAAAYGVTLTIGQVGFQVFGSTSDVRNFITGPLLKILCPIWPFEKSIIWPATRWLNDDELIRLADSWAV